MSDVALKTRTVAATAARSSSRLLRPALPVLTVAAMALLAGCAMQPRDSITVGSVPDDYRTNHPIIIADKEQTLDLPVGAGDRGATRSQRRSIEGFLSKYDRTAAPVLRIMAPAGAANSVAASEAARSFVGIAKSNGVPADRIVITSYQAGAADVSAPVRLAFMAMVASTNKCGEWPKDLGDTTENKNYANFGCSYQNNLAAQLEDPGDMIGPRKQTPIDAQNRDAVIDVYQNAPLDREFRETFDY